MSVSKQLNREAKWSFYLTVLYLIGWVICAYCIPEGRGWLGFPLWFELSCIYLPLLLLVVIQAVIKGIYKDIDLENTSNDD